MKRQDDACMKFHYEKEPLYHETNISGVGLGGRSPTSQGRNTVSKDEAPNIALHPTAFTRKSLSSAETKHSNKEREGLRILHSLEEYQHYCFTCQVSVIRDHKSLVAIFRKDVATLSQRLH